MKIGKTYFSYARSFSHKKTKNRINALRQKRHEEMILDNQK